MSDAARGSGNQEGVVDAGATWAFARNGYVRIDEVYSTDAMDNFYADVNHPIAQIGSCLTSAPHQQHEGKTWPRQPHRT